MQKFIRIMAIIATAFTGFSLLLLFLSILFQRSIATNIYDYPAEVVGLLPQIPVPQILVCFLRLVLVSLLIVCCGNKKGGIWLEVVLIICLVAVLPGISTMASILYIKLVSYAQGMYANVAYSLSNQIATYCLIPVNLGQPIAYVVCGMSIAFKHMNKKMERAVLEAKIGIEEMNELDL